MCVTLFTFLTVALRGHLRLNPEVAANVHHHSVSDSLHNQLHDAACCTPTGWLDRWRQRPLRRCSVAGYAAAALTATLSDRLIASVTAWAPGRWHCDSHTDSQALLAEGLIVELRQAAVVSRCQIISHRGMQDAADNFEVRLELMLLRPSGAPHGRACDPVTA